MSTTNYEMQQATKIFKDHKAKWETLGVLTWKKPDTSNYAMRIIFDENYVYISGDIGCAIVQLTEDATLKALSTYWKTPSYFAEKIQCSTDLYTFDYTSAKQELKEHMDDLMAENPAFRNTLSDIKSDLLEGFATNSGFEANPIAAEKLYEIDSDAYEWLPTAGRRFDLRVWLWLTAFKMAYEQIYEAE